MTTNRRLVAVGVGFLALLALVWARCVWLQVVHASSYRAMAQRQHWTSSSLIPQRGTIYDHTGRVLAMSVRVPSVFANARRVLAKAQTAHGLARVLGRDQGLISKRLNRDKACVWLARQVEPEVTPRLQVFRDEGIGLIEEAQRLYPHGTLASHVLGYVDIDQRGLEGLELAFNRVLQGHSGWRSTVRDARGEFLVGPWTVEADPQAGIDVVLTLDSVVQEITEEALAWGVEKYHAKGGSIIVLDPSSGAVVAMATQPSFDANHPSRAPAASRRNRAITDLLEPGSVFKIVTAAALLEEGLVRPEERFFCEQGAYRTVGRYTLHDHHPHGWLTFHDVIKYSSNIGTAKAAQRLAPEVFYRYIHAFGFGRPTGVELRGEIRGMIASPARWSKLSMYALPIGQEVATTPLQLAVMTAVVANGGWRVQPHLVDRLQTSDGKVIRTYQPMRTRLLRAETTEALEEMLVDVVESGTGQLAKLEGLTVAGKTGTAQKIEPTGRYSHSRFAASFVGYGPVPVPRFVMVVTIDEPRPLYFGGVVSAPVFRRAVERLASYWNLRTPLGTQTVVRLP